MINPLVFRCHQTPSSRWPHHGWSGLSLSSCSIPWISSFEPEPPRVSFSLWLLCSYSWLFFVPYNTKHTLQRNCPKKALQSTSKGMWLQVAADQALVLLLLLELLRLPLQQHSKFNYFHTIQFSMPWSIQNVRCAFISKRKEFWLLGYVTGAFWRHVLPCFACCCYTFPPINGGKIHSTVQKGSCSLLFSIN